MSKWLILFTAIGFWSCSHEYEPVECGRIETDTKGSYLKLSVILTSGGATGNTIYELAFRGEQMASATPILNFLPEKVGKSDALDLAKIYITSNVDGFDLYMKNALIYNFTSWVQDTDGNIIKRFYLLNYMNIKEAKQYLTLGTSLCEAKKPFN